MNLATSDDLVHWTRPPNNPIIKPGDSPWPRKAIWHPHVQKVDGTYDLFFNASGVVNGPAEEYIGDATSQDLLDWTVDEQSPILTGSPEENAWGATGRAGDPSLYRVGDTWYMAWYSWDGVHAQDGLASTSVEDFPLDAIRRKSHLRNRPAGKLRGTACCPPSSSTSRPVTFTSTPPSTPPKVERLPWPSSPTPALRPTESRSFPI